MLEPLAGGSPTSPAPLILTAVLPAPVQAWADALRQAHFPPERNFLAAHVTLFHALPHRVEDELRDLLARLAGEVAPLSARLARVMDLGSGTAFAIDCPDLLDLRAEIAERFHGMLTGQDSHTPRLHVTIQNKVKRDASRALQSGLALSFVPRDFAFTGLALHRYRGGPWDAAGRWTFRRAPR